MAIRVCYDSYMHHVLFTYFTVLIVQDSLEDQPLAEGTLLLKRKLYVIWYGQVCPSGLAEYYQCNNMYIKRAAKQSVELQAEEILVRDEG